MLVDSELLYVAYSRMITLESLAQDLLLLGGLHGCLCASVYVQIVKFSSSQGHLS